MDNRVKTILLPVLVICGIRIRVGVRHGTFDSAGVISIFAGLFSTVFFDSFLVVREEARTTPDRSVSRCYRCALRACGGCLAILDKGMRARSTPKPPAARSPPENVGLTEPLSYDLNASTPLRVLAIAPPGPVQTLHRTLTGNQFPQPSCLREALPAQPLASSISG
jgi:hypothetical protein